MSKPAIINELKKRNPKIKKQILEKVVDLFFQNLKDSLIEKRTIEIRSLGTFFIKEIAEKKQARNPKTI